MAEGTRMLQRRGLESEWNSSAYILAAGEIGVALDTGVMKMGDGVNVWSALPQPYDSQYLPIGGTAANADLLGGISSGGYMHTGDGVTLTQLTDSKKELFGRTFTNATTAITLEVADANTMLLITVDSQTTVRPLNIPTNASVAFPVGAWVDVCNQGLGLVKLVAAGGVTLRGAKYVFPGVSVIRLIKTSTTEWIALNVSGPNKMPRMRVYRNTGAAYGTGSFIAIGWNVVDSGQSFNPSDEFFSIDPAGLAASKRIIVNKDGEYNIVGNFFSDLATNGFLHIVYMTANNVQGTVIAGGSGSSRRHICWTGRLVAGESVGMSQYSATANNDIADSVSDKNDFVITRLGD